MGGSRTPPRTSRRRRGKGPLEGGTGVAAVPTWSEKTYDLIHVCVERVVEKHLGEGRGLV